MEEYACYTVQKSFTINSSRQHVKSFFRALFSWREAQNPKFEATGLYFNNVGLIKPMVLLSSVFLLGCMGNPNMEYQIEANYVAVSPIIDGNLDDVVWGLAKPIVLKDNRTGTRVSDPHLLTNVKACYDNDNLYLAFSCKDPDIWTSFTQRDEHLWTEEAIEVFIDVDEEPENYVEIEVSPANILFDSYIVDPQNIDVAATARLNLPGIRTAVMVNGSLNKRDDIDDSWTVELAIPFTDLITARTEQITTDTEIRINFYRLDMNEGMERGAYSWSPTGASFHKPSVFGKLLLK
ncbi:MAG: carbohydrate-binding family 9-like protein [Maribacter sp.]|nr:carbohydrate-binding family 9-like protein [Maribacter sp.]